MAVKLNSQALCTMSIAISGPGDLSLSELNAAVGSTMAKIMSSPEVGITACIRHRIDGIGRGHGVRDRGKAREGFPRHSACRHMLTAVCCWTCY